MYYRKKTSSVKKIVLSTELCSKRNFGTNSLRALGTQIWNGLPNKMKSAQNISVFKRLIKQWDGVESNCNASQFEKHNISQNQ